MAKLTPRKMARRDGSLIINGYTATLAKIPTELQLMDISVLL